MARRCRAHDWASTPLGDPTAWTTSLVTLVRLVLASHHPMMLTWGDRYTQLYNDAFLPIIGGGARLDAALGADARSFWGPTWAAAMPNIEAVLRGGEPVLSEDQQIPLVRDGREELAYLTYSISPALDDAGATAGLLILVQETTARIEAAAASELRDREMRALTEAQHRADERVRELVHLLDLASDAIIVHDLEGDVLFWNHGATRMFGYEAAEVLGRRAADVNYQDAAVVGEAVGVAFANGQWAGELQMHRRDGSPLVFDSRWTVTRDANGVPHRILAIGTDVTERHALLQQFLRAQRMESIGALAGGIAHDLNNVLAPILMSVQLLRDEVTSAEGVELLEAMEKSATRGAGMVRQILSFARGVEGDRLAVDLRHIARDIEQVLRDTLPKSVRIVNRIAKDLRAVQGNPTQFHQVLMNLVVNARDAMPDGGVITIDGENVDIDEQYATMSPDAKPGRYVRISVTDEGTGMSPDVLARIYEPFFTTKPVGKGTGLGIPTSLGIMRAHGGFMSVYSDVGKGSTFRLYFPADTEVSATVAAAPAVVGVPHGHEETLLLVEDDASVRTVMAATLQAYGYRVLQAGNGAQALERFRPRAAEVALVITDVTMPVMDGPHTLRAILECDPTVPCVVMSGLDDVGARHLPQDLSVAATLLKPFSAETLLRAVAQHKRRVSA